MSGVFSLALSMKASVLIQVGGVVLLFAATRVVCFAADLGAENPSETKPVGVGGTNAVFKHLHGDIYEVGRVQFDKAKRTITFPAAVNMADGVIEYALVHASGKVHESLLKTEVNAQDIHVARLLLGPPETTALDGQAQTPRDLRGPRIRIWAEWKDKGESKRLPLEDLISNTITGTRMLRGDWVYNGSRMVEGTFIAARDGSIMTIIADGDALVNNPRPGRNDDEIWKVNSSLTPPVGTAVAVTIKFEPDREN